MDLSADFRSFSAGDSPLKFLLKVFQNRIVQSSTGTYFVQVL